MYALRHVRLLFSSFSIFFSLVRGILKFESQFSADAFSKVTTCLSSLAHRLLMHMEREKNEINNQCAFSWKRRIHTICRDGNKQKKRIEIVSNE